MSERRRLLSPTALLVAKLLLGTLAVVTTIVLIFKIPWETFGWLGPWLQGFLILVVGLWLAVVLVRGVVMLRQFIARYKKERFLTQSRAVDPTAPVTVEEDSVQRLARKMQQAVETLVPLYAKPWYVLLGASLSGKTALLQSVAHSLPVFDRIASSPDLPTADCDWWAFENVVMLDTTGRYAFPRSAEQNAAQWYHFLQLLHAHRPLQPISGVVITLGADTLAAKPLEELRADAVELRKRIDEAFRELEVDFPVYLLVTRCDTIEGFTEFFSCLPERTLEQVFGYVHVPPSQTDTAQPSAATLNFASIGENLVERLRQLRLSLLDEDRPPPVALRQQVFCFPEEFQALQQPLKTFVDTLLVEFRQHVPRFRGVFFCSAQQQGARHSFLRRQLHFNGQRRADAKGTKAYFLRDLFTFVLPRDQYLVQTTVRARTKRLLRHILGFSISIAVCVLLLLFFLQALWSDRRVYASVDQQPCLSPGSAPGQAAVLTEVDTCRHLLQALYDRQEQRWAVNKLVFNRSGKLATQLRQRYIERFEAAVLTPLDAGLEQRLTTSTDTIPIVFLLIKRIALLNQCLGVFGCPRTLDAEQQPDYRLMYEAGWQQPLGAEQTTILQRTYETYLRWASGESGVVQREQEALANRLRTWFAAKQFAPRQILAWANQHYAAVTVQMFWEEWTGADGKKAAQVDGAYTPGAWQHSIAPFLQRAKAAIPDMAPLLKDFQNDYHTQYFAQWAQFLTAFPRGDTLPRDARRRLALKLLDDQSPYHRVLDAAYANLKPLLPAALLSSPAASAVAASQPVQRSVSWWRRIQQTVSKWWVGTEPPRLIPDVLVPAPELTPPAWVVLMQHYLASESRKTFLEAMKQTRELLTEAPMEKTVQLVQAAFQDGKPSEKSTHPTLRAWGIIQQFRDKEGVGDAANTQPFWPLLERPVQLVWKVNLERTAEFLQKRWEEQVVEPVKRLPETDQVDFLYGPQGKVREFANQVAKPFLADNESRLGQVPGVGGDVPLTTSFLDRLQVEKKLRPLLEQAKNNPPRVFVQATGESSLKQQYGVVEDNTELQVHCDGKSFRVSYHAKEGSDRETSIPWLGGNCGDVTITVSLSCDRSCVDKAERVGGKLTVASSQVVKRYAGSQGLQAFIKEFRGSGERLLGPREFTPADVLPRFAIQAITVFYRVEPSPLLDTLPALTPTPLVPASIMR